jgi:isopenicillin N synthase-like dioxygenase
MAADDYKHLATISLRDFENRKQGIAEQLFRSASTIGFFYIVGVLSGGLSPAMRQQCM